MMKYCGNDLPDNSFVVQRIRGTLGEQCERGIVPNDIVEFLIVDVEGFGESFL